jgi:flagellar motor switch protein FliG
MPQEDGSAASRSAGNQDQELLPGLTKAALLMMSIDKGVAAEVLKRLEPDQIEEIAREIATIDPQKAEASDEVIKEFYNLMTVGSHAETGGLEYARRLLSSVLPREQLDQMLQQVERTVFGSPFSVLKKDDAENLLSFIQEEHPQTVALILAHIPYGKGSQILKTLPPEKQTDVVMRIATMEQTNPELIQEVENGLESRLASAGTQRFRKSGGVQAAAEIINLSDRTTEKAILESLESMDADITQEIRRLMFSFDDIILVDDRGIRAILKEIDNEQLSLALRASSDEVKEKIFTNMSERASELIKEDIEYMGPVKLSIVEEAQQKIVETVRRLEEDGELFIAGRGGAEVVI